MENNRDRKGIFLGVISVATLIVAIIGATFAYFSATVNSANDAVNFTSYEFNAGLSLTRIAPSGSNAITNLIPILPGTDVVNVVSLANDSASEGACIDKNGYTGCVLYQLTITNSGSQALTLKGELKNSAVTAYENLKIMFLTESSGSYAKSGNPISIDAQTVGAVTDLGSSFSVAAQTPAATEGGDPTPGSSTYYFVIYLNDIGEEQNDEMAQHFVGELVFSPTNGSTGNLTAQIS